MVARSDNRRLSRVSERIREGLANALFKTAGDPLLRWVTLTSVSMSSDLRHARVYFATTGSHDSEAVEKSLKKAKPFLQKQLSSLGLRYVPTLAFHYDTSIDTGQRIDDLIREVKQDTDATSTEQTPGKKLDRLISDAESILLITHRNPDGDALGSLLAMGHFLKHLGKDPVVFCPDNIPKILQFLPGCDKIENTLDETSKFDMTIALDVADENLLPSGLPYKKSRGILVVIDHHRQHGDMGDFVIRYEASAVGEILFELSQELLWPMDAHIAECLYTSIVSDTGSFRYSSTTANTHHVAGELLAAGARPWVVATELYESFPLKRQLLLGEVLNSLEVSDDGRYASLHCTEEMLKKTGAAKDDLDGMINLGRSIESVEIAAMFRVEPQGIIKVSFRSKGRIDVGHLASRFGGGGHRNAAGCTLRDLALETARKTVKEAAYEYLSQYAKQDFSEPVT